MSLFFSCAYCIRCAVWVSFACRKCASERQRVLLPRMKLDSRGLPGVNWGVMWFVLPPLPAALPSTLNQIPSDYSLMASVTSVCFKQPTTKDKMTMCAFYDHLHSIFIVPLQFVLKRNTTTKRVMITFATGAHAYLCAYITMWPISCSVLQVHLCEKRSLTA